MFEWAELAGLGPAVQALRQAAAPLRPVMPDWALYNLPDGLWLLSLMLFLGWIPGISGIRGALRFAVAGGSLALEVAQAFAPGLGTFDPADLLALFVAGAVAFSLKSAGDLKPEPTRRRWAPTLASITAFSVLAAGSVPTASAVDQVDIVQTSTTSAFRPVEGELPDYGVRVKILLRNRGAKGRITVSAIFSCSEGRWQGRGVTTLENGESGFVYIDFYQPTMFETDSIVSKVEVVSVD
jgi:hypothetical protein